MPNPIIDLGKLSEPLTKLVETVGAGIGKLYAPIGTILQAKADAKAAIIQAEGAEKVVTLEQRTKHRLEHIEFIRQKNIERVVAQAALEMPKTVSPEPVEQGWLLQFLNGAQDVCEEDMQQIWARVLAGEVSKPGSFGKRTLETLKTLDREEAEFFTALSRFAFLVGESPLVVIDDSMFALFPESMRGKSVIAHFEAIGLLGSEGMISREAALSTSFHYFEMPVAFSGPDLGVAIDPFLPICWFTAIGIELFSICGAKPVLGYVQALSESLRTGFVKLELKPAPSQSKQPA